MNTTTDLEEKSAKPVAPMKSIPLKTEWQAAKVKPSRKIQWEEEEPETFFQKHGSKVIVGVCLLVGGGFLASQVFSGKSAAPSRPAPERMLS
ncbi:MAG: hypothetical protein RL693_850, partial [Verrucomicrobiota bacterium]